MKWELMPENRKKMKANARDSHRWQRHHCQYQKRTNLRLLIRRLERNLVGRNYKFTVTASNLLLLWSLLKHFALTEIESCWLDQSGRLCVVVYIQPENHVIMQSSSNKTAKALKIKCRLLWIAFVYTINQHAVCWKHKGCQCQYINFSKFN